MPIVRVDPTNPAQMIHAARLYRALDESGAAPTIDTRLDSRSNIARYDPAVIELMKRDAEALIKMAAALESMNEGKKDGSR